jgi:hypothetical protein
MSEKTDVFIRVWAPDKIRLGMSISSIARWEMEPDIRLILLICEESLHIAEWREHTQICVPAANFAQASIQLAEVMSTGDIYCGGDDDMLIYGKNFVARGLALMRRREYKDYGLLVASPTNEGEYPTGKYDYPADLPEVAESHAVGGPGFLRKGLMTDISAPQQCDGYGGYQ